MPWKHSLIKSRRQPSHKPRGSSSVSGHGADSGALDHFVIRDSPLNLVIEAKEIAIP